MLPLPSWYALVGVITSSNALTYIMGGAGLRVLRRTAPELKRPFRLAASGFWSPVGFIAAAMIVYWSGTSTLDYVVTAVLFGMGIYALFYAPNKMGASPAASITLGIVMMVVVVVTGVLGPIGNKTIPHLLYIAILAVEILVYSLLLWAIVAREQKHQIWRAAWYFVLVFGFYFLTYFSAFGPSTLAKNPLVPFPVDTIIAIVFALIVYYGAVASGYKTEEIEDIVRAARESRGTEGGSAPA